MKDDSPEPHVDDLSNMLDGLAVTQQIQTGMM